MANVKISQLPSWTGSSADLRWFVMNNSGETTTYKFSGWTSQIVPGDGSSSVRSIYFSSNKNLSPYGVLIGGLTNNQILSTGNYNTIIGGEGSTITSGEDNGIFAAKNSTTDASSNYSVIIGGRSHTINNQFGSILGGAQNTAGYLSAAIGGFNLNATNQACILGGENNTANGAYSTILGGFSHNISSNASVILGGQQNNVSGLRSGTIGGFNARARGLDSVIVGGQNNLINSNGAYNVIAGGEQNTASGDINSIFNGRLHNVSGGIDNTIVGGYLNTLSSSNRSIISGGRDNNITGSEHSGCYVSSASTITNRTRAVMIGTNGKTASRDNATFVENLVVFDYANLNYADDTAAAAGGVVLGQVYHNNGAMRIRIV